MTSNNDYKTPKDRISADFRNQLFAEESSPVGTFFKTDYYGERRNSPYSAGCKCGEAERRSPSRDTAGSRYTENGAPLAMVYSPHQKFEGLYTEDEALCKGSLFEGLYLPFEAYCCGRKMGGCR